MYKFKQILSNTKYVLLNILENKYNVCDGGQIFIDRHRTSVSSMLDNCFFRESPLIFATLSISSTFFENDGIGHANLLLFKIIDQNEQRILYECIRYEPHGSVTISCSKTCSLIDSILSERLPYDVSNMRANEFTKRIKEIEYKGICTLQKNGPQHISNDRLCDLWTRYYMLLFVVNQQMEIIDILKYITKTEAFKPSSIDHMGLFRELQTIYGKNVYKRKNQKQLLNILTEQRQIELSINAVAASLYLLDQSDQLASIIEKFKAA